MREREIEREKDRERENGKELGNRQELMQAERIRTFFFKEKEKKIQINIEKRGVGK